MQIICVDDHPIILQGLICNIREILPYADIQGFTKADEAYEYAKANGCDVLFCEIALYENAGITLAEKIRSQYEKANVIFATVCSEKEFAGEVLKIRPSGYITKPVTRERIKEELNNLRYPIQECV